MVHCGSQSNIFTMKRTIVFALALICAQTVFVQTPDTLKSGWDLLVLSWSKVDSVKFIFTVDGTTNIQEATYPNIGATMKRWQLCASQ